MIPIKNKNEIEKIREAGNILAKIANILQKNIRAGVTTAQLDQIAENEFNNFGVASAFKGYRGFPAYICTSVNEEVVHGIPSERKLQTEDLLSIDLGIKMDGYYADMAFTQAVEKTNPRLKKFIEVCRQSLAKGIKKARVGNRVFDISSEIQTYVEMFGFSVVRDFVGHGIGRDLHEEPQIPNFGRPNTGEKIQEGMVFAIEPMVNMGTWQVEITDSGWTAVTKDRLPSCHFEHTVAVLKEGPIILTKVDE